MAMTLTALSSSPLSPLAAEARSLSHGTEELSVATAFVSDAAVQDVLEAALSAGAKVRFLTGTFGKVTRLRTFRKIHQLSQETPLEARIWNGDFHAKLFLWRRAQEAVAWIGSANLTDQGLRQEGEIVAQVRARWAAGRASSLAIARHAGQRTIVRSQQRA